MNELADVISGAMQESKQQTGSDYTAKVTRVEGNTAYVQITGSDIADTPVAMSISAKAGDMVRVRVADGKAWITGNDTAPPADNAEIQKAVDDTTNYVRQKISDSEGNYSQIKQSVDEVVIEVGNAQTAAENAQSTADGRMKADMSNKASSITIQQGSIAFKSNTLIVDATNFKLEANGNAKFSGIIESQRTYTPSGLPSFTDAVRIGDTAQPVPIYIVRTGGGKSELSAVVLTFALGQQSTSYTSSVLRFIDQQANKSSELAADSLEFTTSNNYCSFDATGAHPGSDRRLKDDIEEFDSGLALRLHPVRFRFKGEKEIHYGFIAQEVQEVIPDAVRENPDGYLGLNYSEIIAPLCALVQKQEQRISQLEKRLEALEEDR